jgi:hypothetical protein
LFEKQKLTFSIVEHVGYRMVGGCSGERDKKTVFYITGITAFGSKLYTAGIPKVWLNRVVLEKIYFLSVH